MRRGFGKTDLVVLALSLCAVMTVDLIWSSMEFSAADAFWAFVLNWLVVGGCVMFFFHRFVKKQDFRTSHGTKVWTGGIEEITPELMEKALERFLDVMSEEQNHITYFRLWLLLSCTGIRWKRSFWRYSSSYAVSRDGYMITLWWPGSIADSDLYHQLLHVVNVAERLPRVKSEADRAKFKADNENHNEGPWWMLEGMMVDDF